MDFKKNWESIPYINYYENLKGVDLDKNFLFLTNNISENISSISNCNFKGNYFNFLEWKNIILSTKEKFENSKKILTRINLISEILINNIYNIHMNKNKVTSLSEII